MISETQKQAIEAYLETQQQEGISDPGFIVRFEARFEDCQVWVANHWKSGGYWQRGIRIAIFLGDQSDTTPLEPFVYLIFVPLAGKTGPQAFALLLI